MSILSVFYLCQQFNNCFSSCAQPKKHQLCLKTSPYLTRWLQWSHRWLIQGIVHIENIWFMESPLKLILLLNMLHVLLTIQILPPIFFFMILKFGYRSFEHCSHNFLYYSSGANSSYTNDVLKVDVTAAICTNRV